MFVPDGEQSSKSDKAPLTTGDMARLSGSTLRTVRFYESEGIIKPQSRTDGGHRLFGPTELKRLKLALDLREAGLSLNDIKTLYSMKADCVSAQEASRRMSDALESRIRDMQQKIAKLSDLRRELSGVISVISECHTCDGQPFPASCQLCDVLQRPTLPRAVEVLWKD